MTFAAPLSSNLTSSSSFRPPATLSSPSLDSSSPSVSISLLINELLVYIREMAASSAVRLESPWSEGRRKASLIRVFSRLRDSVTGGVGSAFEQSRWAACWNEEDSCLYRAMVKALERMVASRRGRGEDVTDAHLIDVLKAKCPV